MLACLRRSTNCAHQKPLSASAFAAFCTEQRLLHNPVPNVTVMMSLALNHYRFRTKFIVQENAAAMSFR